jgi:hypothetical protein
MYTVNITNQKTNKTVAFYLIDSTNTINSILYYFYWLPGKTDDKITGCNYEFIVEPRKEPVEK